MFSIIGLLYKAQAVAQKGKTPPARLHHVPTHDNLINRILSRIKCFPLQQNTFKLNRQPSVITGWSVLAPVARTAVRQYFTVDYLLRNSTICWKHCTTTPYTSLHLSLNLLTQCKNFVYKWHKFVKYTVWLFIENLSGSVAALQTDHHECLHSGLQFQYLWLETLVSWVLNTAPFIALFNHWNQNSSTAVKLL